MEGLIVFGYLGAMGAICIFSLHQLNLAFIYLRRKKVTQPPELAEWPMVTVQLPIYNERYVVERLLDAICRFDYPSEKLQILVLDDSTDDTTVIIDQKVNEWSEKVNLEVLRRPDREGYKAGALQYGLGRSTGEFIAVFDADFLPEPDFLTKTLPHFTSQVGMVQTRWSHLNQDFSLLTKLQAFGLNAHFTVEQEGRASSGKFMNFNGTAGVWRKECIENSGGWQADTLTEDLDLSYRAQLKGWGFKYLEDVCTPAELPVLVPAIKSQQYRWNKGAAETARKHFLSVLLSKISVSRKIYAIFHLLNSSVFIFLLIAAILSVPLLFIKGYRAEFTSLLEIASILIVGFLGIVLFYWTSAKATHPLKTLGYFLVNLPVFLSFTLGLTLHNAVAVSEGYLGIKTPFIRTPKFNIIRKSDSWKGNRYILNKLTILPFLELGLAFYFLFGFVSAFLLNDFGLAPFHLLLTFGFGSVAILSLKSHRYD